MFQKTVVRCPPVCAESMADCSVPLPGDTDHCLATVIVGSDKNKTNIKQSNSPPVSPCLGLELTDELFLCCFGNMLVYFLLSMLVQPSYDRAFPCAVRDRTTGNRTNALQDDLP